LQPYTRYGGRAEATTEATTAEASTTGAITAEANTAEATTEESLQPWRPRWPHPHKFSVNKN